MREVKTWLRQVEELVDQVVEKEEVMVEMVVGKRKKSRGWGLIAGLVGIWLVALGGLVVVEVSKVSKVSEASEVTEKGGFGEIVEQEPEVERVELAPVQVRWELPASVWVPQTFNNCVPATVSMVLQHFGYNVSQAQTKADLRTNADDKNVFSDEVVDYVEEKYGLGARLLYNGDVEKLKLLVGNGVYVVMEAWLHPNEDIGHALIIRGYDDEKGVLIGDDPYIAVGVEYPYEVFEETQWRAFNREYVPIYRPEQEEVVREIVGEDWDERVMWRRAVEFNLGEVEGGDVYDWFNLGTSYYGLGENEKAGEAFDTARRLGWPVRMLWYQIQPVQAYNELGEYEKALELVREGLRANDSFAELYVEAARAYQGLGDGEAARAEMKKAASYDSRIGGEISNF